MGDAATTPPRSTRFAPPTSPSEGRWRAPLLTLLLIGAAGTAEAQDDATESAVAEADDEATREAARAAFVRGREAYNAGRHEEALAAYLEAIALRDHPALRVAAAQSFFQLERYREALEELEIASQAEGADASTREQAAELTRLASERVGRLIVTTPGADEPVVIEGLDVCAPPCDLRVDPGSYTVRSAERAPQSVEIAAGETVRLVLSVEEAIVTRDAPPPVVIESRWEPGPLFYVGLGLTAIGAAGSIAFGVLTLDLDAEWQRDACSRQPMNMRCLEIQDQGTLFGALTTASMVTGGVGLVLVVIDLLVSRASSSD